MKKIMKTLSLLLAVGAMAFGSGLHHEDTKVARAEGTWTLVKDASTLAVDDQVIIVAKDSAVAMSTTQNSNNRGQANITKSGDTATFESAVQVFTLKSGDTNGTFAFYTGSGYIYCASTSSKNYLRTQSSLDAKASWTISITKDTATIKSKVSGINRNLLSYNPQNGIFACYSSVQKDIQLYKKEISTNTLTDITLSGSYKTDYKEGESFDKTGLVVTANYSDGTKVDVTSKVTITPSEKLTTLNTKVIVSYTEGTETKTKDIAINVTARTLESISVKTNPTKMSYYPGEKLDLSGLVLTATYNDDSTLDITSGWDDIDYTFTDEDYENGEKTFTIIYSGKETILTVDVVEAPVIATATITFDSTSKRTEYSSSKQVWTENGITVTNNKASSETNVGDYSNPARFYKDSQLVIEYAKEMTKIEFTFSGEQKYLTALKNSITSGATVTASGTVVTAELDVPSTSFTISLSAGQGRANSITIYYASSGDTTPVYPTDFELSASEITLEVGDESSLKVKFVGDNVNVNNVSWSTANSDIIDLNEGTGEFKALKEGTATITVSVQTGEQTYLPKTCTIKVNKAAIINFSAESKIAGNKFSSNDVDFYIVDNDSIRNTDSQGRGAQFGTATSPAGTVKFITRFTKFAKDGFKLIINAAMGSGGDATLKVYLGNVQLKDTTKKDTINLTSTATDYEFIADENTPESGYLTIEMNATEKAMFLKSIKVYGEMSANDDTFCKLVNDITTAETCTDYTDAADLMDVYNGLTADDKTIFSYLTCADQDYDWANGGKENPNLLDVTVSLMDKLTYMKSYADWKAAHPNTNSLGSNLLSNITSSNNILIILVVGLLGLTSILGYYFLNKKKYAK